MKPTTDTDSVLSIPDVRVIPDIRIAFKKIHPDARVPLYASQLAAGADLFACLDKPVDLPPLDRVLVPCGFAVAIPPGYEIQVRPRSGLALKQGLFLLNAPGTIDADYRGELGVILANFSRQVFRIESGMRIAQMVLAPVSRMQFCQAEELSESARDTGGFGSTGI